MKFVIITLTVAFLCTAYLWPIVPLIIYPLNRRRGFLAALYCCAVGVFFGIGPHYSHFNIGAFYEAAVFTSAARLIAESAGLLEKPRRAWLKRHPRSAES
ncbi:hypothetical protein CQW39_29010 [Streptomyces griseofuscus]|uniref:hypothetical protein n=1 Tax=Streptomyces TaxID=1883 RepID=UPI000F647253|nr:hypothetical protein [Streptomyces griseofuscus]RRQ74020.1 hypothetical protein CQW39_29010 [Streptomyces griseofuscus]